MKVLLYALAVALVLSGQVGVGLVVFLVTVFFIS